MNYPQNLDSETDLTPKNVDGNKVWPHPRLSRQRAASIMEITSFGMGFKNFLIKPILRIELFLRNTGKCESS